MQSPLFLVKLRPDLHLHRLTLISGVLLTFIGIALICKLDLPPGWRAIAGIVWIVDCSWTLRRLAKGFAGVRLIVLDSAGGVRTKCTKGDIVPRSLHAGSLVLARVAWLRLKDPHGHVYAGLYVKSRVNATDWHRLQLLWQQSRRAFGHPAGP